jgi:hypothetical protein
MSERHVTPELNAERYVLYCLTECTTCGGRGKTQRHVSSELKENGLTYATLDVQRCSECRGEGKQRSELGSCATEEALGVMLATLGREGQLEGCAHGCLDTEGEPGQKWLWKPWLPSARNVSDAARTLAKSKKTS